jgi:Fe-S-cluster containining protein
MDLEAELSALCRSCGLCCDGSLFGRVMFEGDERAPKKHLRLLHDGRGFEQPCTALGHDRACAIYDERPAACRRFVCRLFDRHRSEHVPVDARIAVVARTRELLRRVDELTSDERVELEARMNEDFARAAR